MRGKILEWEKIGEFGKSTAIRQYFTHQLSLFIDDAMDEVSSFANIFLINYFMQVGLIANVLSHQYFPMYGI